MRWPEGADRHVRFTIRDVPLHLVYVNFTYYLTVLVGGRIGSVHVNVHHVFGDSLSSNKAMESRTSSYLTHPIALFIVHVLHYKDHIEARQYCCLKVDILSWY